MRGTDRAAAQWMDTHTHKCPVGYSRHLQTPKMVTGGLRGYQSRKEKRGEEERFGKLAGNEACMDERGRRGVPVLRIFLEKQQPVWFLRKNGNIRVVSAEGSETAQSSPSGFPWFQTTALGDAALCLFLPLVQPSQGCLLRVAGMANLGGFTNYSSHQT